MSHTRAHDLMGFAPAFALVFRKDLNFVLLLTVNSIPVFIGWHFHFEDLWVLFCSQTSAWLHANSHMFVSCAGVRDEIGQHCGSHSRN